MGKRQETGQAADAHFGAVTALHTKNRLVS